MSEQSYDAIVLGAGPAGEVCAGSPRRRRAEGRDRRAAPDRRRMLLLRLHALEGAAAARRRARRGAAAARESRSPRTTSSTRRRSSTAATRSIHDLDDSVQLPWLEEREIDLFRGAGRFDGERPARRSASDGAHRAQGGDRRHRQRRRDAADRRARLGRGLEQPPGHHRQAGPREHDRARRRPGRLRALPGLGLARHPGDAGRGRRAPALAARSPSPARRSATSLRENFGVDVRTGVKVEKVERRRRRRDRRARATAATVEAAEILVAVGRVPHTAELGLDSVGVEPDEHGFLETDDRLRVGGRDWLYAIGDVNGRALFTHMGKYQAWVAGENLLGREVEAVAEGIGSPRVTFTDPQVAAVGKTLDAGPRGRHRRDRRSTSPPTARAGASFQGKDTGGTSRLVDRPGPRDDRRRHLHRLRDRRLPPGRDRRDRRRGPARPAAPRDRRPTPRAARSG